jgi:hypothetical protein
MIRRLRLAAVVLVSILLAPIAARSEDDPALYQSTAIVTGTDMRQRPLGFAETLTDVLVKVSGDPRLRDDQRVKALGEHANTLVASYTYVDPMAFLLHHDDQGTYDRSYELTVHFDPAKIDAALADLGAPPWRGPRPLLVPIIIVRRDISPFLLSATTPRGEEMRQAIARVAADCGLGVHFPTEDDLAARGVSLIGFPAPLGAPEPGQLQIPGSLSFDVHAQGWVGIWHVRLNGAEHEWRIAGVGFDQAFADMVRGAVMLAHGTGTP